MPTKGFISLTITILPQKLNCDLFSEESDWKSIAFNEYYDTIVDDEIIAQSTLNGIFINRFFADKVDELDKIIALDNHLSTKIISQNNNVQRVKFN